MGFSKSGKTTAIESLIRYLKNQNYNVASIKHIHIEKFSIDTPGKNTWRMAESGADPVVSLSANETAFITKEHLSLDSMIKICKIINNERINQKQLNIQKHELDFIFVEGIWNNSYPKVINMKDPDEFEEQLNIIIKNANSDEILNSVICYSGVVKSEEELRNRIIKSLKEMKLEEGLKNYLEKVPFINIKENPEDFMKIYKNIQRK